MIEQLVTNLIDALNANTIALTHAAANAPVAADKAVEAAPAKAGKVVKAKAEPVVATPEHSQEEVTAALLKIKDDFNISHARDVMKQFKYDKMGDIKPEHFDVVFAAAEAKHAELTAEAGNDDAEDDNGL